MVSALGLVGLLVLVTANTALAAIATRFLRIRLRTTWGTIIYVALFVPGLITVSTLVLSGVLGLGGVLGGRAFALVVSVVIPIVVGISVDWFLLPHPAEVALTEATDVENETPDSGSGSSK